MIQRLRDIDAIQDVQKNPYENRRRAAYLGRLVAKRQGDQANLIHNLGIEFLRAGDSVRALRAFKALREGLAKGGVKTTPEQRAELRFYEITAWLRLAEQQNCLGHHGRESCLMPIRGSGVHVDRKASSEAIRLIEKELSYFPDDLADRWLLNLAWMTLGGWPDKVPERFRIAPEVFASKAPMPRLLDVGGEAGVNALGLSGGAVAEDFDGDGLIDIMCSSWHLKDQIRLFRNKGDGTFEDVTTAAGLEGLTGGLNLVHADYDNDGDFDVLVLRGAWRGPSGHWPNSLLRNDGKGRFTDVTEAAGLLSFHPSPTAAFADFDRDGDLDLFIGNESRGKDTHDSEFFRNEGDGTFKDITHEVGLEINRWVKAVSWGDIDNDGDPDLYETLGGAFFGDRYTNALFLNPGSGNRQITLRFEGTKSNRCALGARFTVRITMDDGT